MDNCAEIERLDMVTFYPPAPLRQIGEGVFELAKPECRDVQTLYPLIEAGAGRRLVLKDPCDDVGALLRDVVRGEIVMDASGQLRGVWRVDAAKLMEIFDKHPSY
ncbi:hypothetical protein IQ03_00563 [Gemmobacter caeni]|uniref:Uncharacterized protein n=2 Tax=Gemmobacter caeni TaxID=589035 RepID=A0A2T6A5H8_9RHOB|nr:hypothetical protein C8N34_1396 [Gemmobacter caeni]TWJ05755.1 hypothetical protein IQ03_00563 [Gemmobacter caeni]